MSDRFVRTRGFTFGIAGLVLMVVALAYLILKLILKTHLYATALVLTGVVALLASSLLRRFDSAGKRLLNGKSAAASGAADRNTPASWQQQLDYRQTLLDTVAVALFVVDEEGKASAVNHAARRLAGRDIYRLEDVEVIGSACALSLLALPVGTRRILELRDGSQSLASVTLFTIPGLSPRRLIGLQRIAGELDAVEVKAWQDVSKVLAHEMMNSLTPIASLSESLEQLVKASRHRDKEAIDPELFGALEAIRRRSRGLMEFVERYREVAQVPTPEIRDVRLSDLLSGIERLLAETLRRHGIRHSTEISPPTLTCRADPHLLEQALINLFRNAIDALTTAGGADGKPDAYIEVLCRLKGGEVEIIVNDNGPGLPAGSGDQIFVPFFTTKSAGSGIGLSVARQIALAHAGRLEALKREPIGSAFVLSLPA